MEQRYITTIEKKRKKIQQALGKWENMIFRLNQILRLSQVFNNNNYKKITRHPKKQESMTNSNEKSKSTKFVPEKTQKADSIDKDIKTTVLKTLKELKKKYWTK